MSVPTKTILMIAPGSRGDVQPFVAVGQHIQEQEMLAKVVIAAHLDFEDFITQRDLGFVPIHQSVMETLKTPEGKEMKNANLFNAFKKIAAFSGKMYTAWMRDIKAAVEQLRPDLVVMHAIAFIGGAGFILNKHPELKWCIVHTVPGYPTREFAPSTAGVGYSTGFRWLDRWLWTFGSNMIKTHFGPIIKQALASIDEQPYKPEKSTMEVLVEDKVTCFYIYSSHVLPVPQDWPATQKVIGFWNDVETVHEPIQPALASFLDASAGKPVVYIGFGSMLAVALDTDDEVKRVIRCMAQGALESMKTHPLRVILHTYVNKDHSLDNLSDMPTSEDLFIQQEPVAHQLLFPRCELVVHHGGAGHMQTALYHGLPAVILPAVTTADQIFWGAVMEMRGCGIKGPCFPKIKHAHVSKLLCRAVDNLSSLTGKAQELGAQLRSENAFAAFANFAQEQLQ